VNRRRTGEYDPVDPARRSTSSGAASKPTRGHQIGGGKQEANRVHYMLDLRGWGSLSRIASRGRRRPFSAPGLDSIVDTATTTTRVEAKTDAGAQPTGDASGAPASEPASSLGSDTDSPTATISADAASSTSDALPHHPQTRRARSQRPLALLPKRPVNAGALPEPANDNGIRNPSRHRRLTPPTNALAAAFILATLPSSE
jgi:hypothetical protein